MGDVGKTFRTTVTIQQQGDAMTTGADAKLKCPKCQTEMRIVETVCPKCGATGDDLKPPVGSNEIELPKVEDVLCQKCNTLTPEDNMLCKHCGANWNALDGAAQKDETPAPVVDPAAEEAKKLEDLQKAVAAVLAPIFEGISDTALAMTAHIQALTESTEALATDDLAKLEDALSGASVKLKETKKDLKSALDQDRVPNMEPELDQMAKTLLVDRSILETIRDQLLADASSKARIHEIEENVISAHQAFEAAATDAKQTLAAAAREADLEAERDKALADAKQAREDEAAALRSLAKAEALKATVLGEVKAAKEAKDEAVKAAEAAASTHAAIGAKVAAALDAATAKKEEAEEALRLATASKNQAEADTKAAVVAKTTAEKAVADALQVEARARAGAESADMAKASANKLAEKSLTDAKAAVAALKAKSVQDVAAAQAALKKTNDAKIIAELAKTKAEEGVAEARKWKAEIEATVIPPWLKYSSYGMAAAAIIALAIVIFTG